MRMLAARQLERQRGAVQDKLVTPDIQADEPELLRSPFIHGIKRMPCTFTAHA